MGHQAGTWGERLPLGSPAPVPSTCCHRRPEAVYGRPGAHWARAPPHSAWPAARPHTSPFNWAFSLTQCHAGLFCQRRHNLCSLKPGGARGRCSRNSSRPLGAAQQERGGAGPKGGGAGGPRRPPGTPLLRPRLGPGPRHLKGPQQVLHPARAPGALGQGHALGQRRVGHPAWAARGKKPQDQLPSCSSPGGRCGAHAALSLLPSQTTCPPTCRLRSCYTCASVPSLEDGSASRGVQSRASALGDSRDWAHLRHGSQNAALHMERRKQEEAGINTVIL